jgi:hypothetical protein
MKFHPRIALSALCLAVPGCANIGETGTQTVAVTTPPADGAKCVLTTPSGTYFVTTPGNAIVQKSMDDMNVACDKPGFLHSEQKFKPHMNVGNAGNMMAGGIVQLGLSAATGALYIYPVNLVVPMSPATPAARVSTR